MPLVIKRYENRKLYDTVAKRYVSLEDIGDLVRQGHEIQVVDNATGKDLTAETLTKIVMEEGRKGRRRLPSEFLHDLIRWGDKVRHSTVDQFEQRVDQLVRASLNRLGPVREMRQKMDALTERIEALGAEIAAAAPEGSKSRLRDVSSLSQPAPGDAGDRSPNSGDETN